MARHTPPPTHPSKPTRRQFLKQSATIAGAAAAASLLSKSVSATLQVDARPSVALIVGPGDPVAESTEGQWAIHHLADTLSTRNITVHILPPEADTSTAKLTIIAGGSKSPFIRNYRIDLAGPEALALIPVADTGRPTILATGSDPRGLVYALTELADHATLASNPLQALQISERIIEKPANPIRGIMRLFASDVEDKPWFYDREFWPKYFDMLITNRFNRFNLALGLSYDFSTNLRDVYFFFAYPFFLNVPGYDVKAIARDGKPIPAEEQQRNLEMLRFITDQAALRGLDFQLGLWTHNYRWTNSPNASHTIEGLNAQTQAPYSRDAMHALIEACPGITGITLRTHGESGVPEGSYDLWKVIMAGIAGHKTPDGKTRTIELDLHGKTMTQQMIDTAHTTNMPVTISCKFWAEHMGLPYIQSSIRETEMPKGRDATGLMALSSGTRSFLRYGVGDLLNKNRSYKVINRVWPGTQRLLLWGDPLYAAEYGRCSSFSGMDGIEYFDPLSFKGRAGSGLPPAVPNAGRSGYADASLLPPGGGNNDWQKYLYTYRLIGRLSYNPDAKAETWQRQLQSDFGSAAPQIESALANSSRILPLITTAHLPAAANFQYWPEVYVNMSLYGGATVYTEVPQPRVFGNVSSLDPQLFASILEYADSLLANKPLARINPVQVAQQLEAWSQAATKALTDAEKLDADRPAAAAAAYRRATVDTVIAAGIGQFFAYKFRAAVLYTLFDRSGHEPARAAALEQYKKARESWARLADTAKVYASDLPFGPDRQLRRHWSERTADIDTDIAGLQTRQPNRGGTDYLPATIDKLIQSIINPITIGAKSLPTPKHTPPASFKPNAPCTLQIEFLQADATIRLCYRRVNQGERYVSVEMQKQGNSCSAIIPADYTNSIFPIEYYFEIQTPSAITLHPGFKENFTGQPYFVIQQST